jgi:ribosome-associated toxin RatA of RatAB toxin-antitoxin module
MYKRVLILTASIMLVMATALIAAGPPPGAPTVSDPKAFKGLSQDGIARLKKGEVLILKDISVDQTGKPSGMIEAAVIFNQPIDKVWTFLADQAAEQRKFLPYLAKSDLVSKKGNHVLINFRLVVMGVNVDYQVDHVLEKEKYAFHWALDPTFKNDLKRLQGFWQFYYMDDTHTLARYGTWFEIGIGIPKFVQGFLIKRDLPESLNNVKKFVDSGGTWRRPDYKGA